MGQISRGTLFLMASQVIFLVSSYVIHITLARQLGPSAYGTVGVVLSLLIISQIIVMGGIPRAASKYISSNINIASAVIPKVIWLQLFISLLLMILYYSAAPVIAQLLGDRALIAYIRLLVMVIPFTGLFYLYANGFLNGLHLFSRQAFLIVLYSLFKVAFVLILLSMGMVIESVILGYFLASVMGCIIARLLMKKTSSNKTDSQLLSNIGRLAAPLTIISLVYILFLNSDILMVKTMLKDNIQTGFYVAANNLAKASYFVFSAVSLTLLPFISRAYKSNTERISYYLTKALFYVITIVLPLTAFVIIASDNIMLLLYEDSYLPASVLLKYLIVAFSLFTVFAMLSTLLIAIDQHRFVVYLSVISYLIFFALAVVFINSYAARGIAFAYMITMAFATILSYVYLHKRFPFQLPWRVYVKLIAATLGASVVLYMILLPGMMMGLSMVGAGVVYGGLLVVLKVFKKEDLLLLRNTIQGN